MGEEGDLVLSHVCGCGRRGGPGVGRCVADCWLIEERKGTWSCLSSVAVEEEGDLWSRAVAESWLIDDYSEFLDGAIPVGVGIGIGSGWCAVQSLTITAGGHTQKQMEGNPN